MYYDGQFDDARMNVAIAQSAAERGAIIATHTEVIGFEHDPDGCLKAALIRSREGGERIRVEAKAFVNATGPFADVGPFSTRASVAIAASSWFAEGSDWPDVKWATSSITDLDSRPS
jgi:glycerol-3-phosphate dehydrogenase